MAVKPIAELRTRFEAADAPTQQDWINLIDSLDSLKTLAREDMATDLPVTMVADEAARLVAGADIEIGQRVKQTDNGITYVKQQETGGLAGDWEATGDAAIVIADVNGLQTALDRLLSRSQNDSTSGRLGAAVFYLTSIGTNETGADVVAIPLPAAGFEYAFRAENFTISVSEADPPVNGVACTVAIKNTNGSAITASLGAGLRALETAFPVSVDAGKWLVITVMTLEVPITGTSPGVKYFVCWGKES